MKDEDKALIVLEIFLAMFFAYATLAHYVNLNYYYDCIQNPDCVYTSSSDQPLLDKFCLIIYPVSVGYVLYNLYLRFKRYYHGK